MVIQHNMSLNNAERQYGIAHKGKAKSAEKLASGYRINRSADDAAGISISEKMRRQTRGLNQASMNCQDAVSLTQIADGALAEVHDIIHRGAELSTRAANDTLTQEDRETIQQELSQILQEIDSLKERTTFNEIKVLDGGDPIIIQAGSEVDQEIAIKLADISLEKLGLDDVDVSVKNSSTDGPKEAIEKFKKALSFVSQERTNMGAYQNRFQHTIKNLNNIVENTTKSESIVRDTDMASEMVKHSNGRVLTELGYSVMSQAGKTNEAVMKLIQ